MYAILDIETTGGQFNEEGITEIAIYKFDGHEVVDQFISLVNPEKEIQPFVVKLTGINNAMLRSAPKFYEVAKRIIEITQDCIVVAHNSSFDYRILRTEFNRLGYDFIRPTLCTVELSKKLIPASYAIDINSSAILFSICFPKVSHEPNERALSLRPDFPSRLYSILLFFCKGRLKTMIFLCLGILKLMYLVFTNIHTMKKLVLSIFMISALAVNAQENIIKLNLLGLALGNIGVQYERTLGEHSSLAMGISLQHSEGFAL